MMIRTIQILLLTTTLTGTAVAQSRTKAATADTLSGLTPTDTLTVHAFSLHTQWKETPAAIAVVTDHMMQRTGQSTLVPVMNTLPGVRMEERSPGSYRLSVRGSLLRSPFGVRNLKVYWNDIPLTDAGGNTYFNLVDLSQLQSLEVIKGPAASLYGANTGGAVLLHSADALDQPAAHHWQAGISGGSYGLFNEQLGYGYTNVNTNIQVKQQHLQSDGYRQQSRLRKDVIQSNATFRLNRIQQLSVLGFYTDLYYQTPGGITLQQMQQNPRLARQKTPATPGAADQKAAIYNKTAFGGAALQTQLGAHWQNTTVLMLNHTDFRNPFITNYETRNEWNYGGRTSFQYRAITRNIEWSATAGAEWLQNKTDDNNYGNRAGVRDTVQSKDKLQATQSFAFAQAQAQWHNKLVLQAGLSRNLLTYHYHRLTDVPLTAAQEKSMGDLWAPRVSILYKVTQQVALYAIAARGFSPPSLAEVRPADGQYHGDLEPEHGWNYELGVKGMLWRNRIQFDVNAYDFRLQDAIVRRTNAGGAEYFINAGGTSQKGVEAFFSVQVLPFLSVFNSFTYQHYRFTHYTMDDHNYSGNHLTGVPQTVNVSGLDASFAHGWYINVTLNNTSSIPLADDNSVFASSYQLLQAKAGYGWHTGNFRWEAFAVADNLLNRVYSLGNDINAIGSRYYNPAPARNVSGGLIIHWK